LDALPLVERALRIEESNRGLEDLRVASCLVEYSFLLEQLGKPAEAAEARARAEQIRNSKAAPKPAN
jgi:hypothetical protein